MARTDLPALDVGPVRHDALPPQQIDRMDLVAEHALLELAHQLALLRFVEFTQHPLVQLRQLRVLEIAVIRFRDRTWEVFADIDERIDDILAVPLGRYRETAVAQCLKPRAG